MGEAVKRILILLLLATTAHAEERFGVFEFFVRGSGAYCIAAAPSVTALQETAAGRAVALEYAYDAFNRGRVDRFWAAYSPSGPTTYLPLVMVGSGFAVSAGPVDYATRYRQMLDAELARPPRAAIRAWIRRSGFGLQVFATARNLGSETLTASRQPTFWLVVWEEGRIGLTNTWVLATEWQALTGALSPGATANVTFEIPALDVEDWQRVRALVLLEDIPPGAAHYDMLQAAIAQPAALSVAPSAITLGPAQPEAVVTLEGPHALTFTATSEVEWLSVTPSGGSLPGEVAIRLIGSPPPGATGAVRFSAAGSGMDFAASVVVTAAGLAESWSAVVPAVAHTPGGFGSVWRTDLAAVNESSATAAMTLTFMPGTGTSVSRIATLPPGGTHEWSDVLVSLFDVEGDASASGAVRISADRALAVSSRTYNQAENATYGGYLPAVTTVEGVEAGQIAILPQLARTSLFRTNVAVTNLGETTAVATIRLYGRNDEPLGEPVPVEVPARELVQVVDVFGAAGAGDRDLAYAAVEPATPGVRLWAYASVVDNRTGDPTIIPAEVQAPPSEPAVPSERTISSVGHTPGAFGSLWRTDVALVNASSAGAKVEFRFVPSDGSPPLTASAEVPPGTRSFADAVVSLLGLGAEASALGALHIRSDRPVIVSSRTFNAADEGTFGAHLAGMDASRALTSARAGVIPQVKRSAHVRTNVAFASLVAFPVTVGIRLRGADGCALGTEKSLIVPAYGFAQENDIFASCGTGDAPIAWARVEVKTEGGAVLAFASVVDNRTGDPTFIPVARSQE